MAHCAQYCDLVFDPHHVFGTVHILFIDYLHCHFFACWQVQGEMNSAKRPLTYVFALVSERVPRR